MQRFTSVFEKLFNVAERLDSIPGVAIIVIASVIAKLACIFVFDGGLNTFPKEGSDVGFYNNAALVLWRSGTFGLAPDEPNVGMPPGQSAFLALLYWLSDGSIAFAKLMHVALLTAVAVLTFVTGKKLVNSSVGFWAAILIAIDPAQAYLSATFLSEPLFIFFMVLSVLFLIMNQSRPDWKWLVGVGIGFGLAGLTRNQGWLYALALWLGAIVTRGRVLSIRSVSLALLITLATIAPWTIRNYLVAGRFIPVSSEGGLTFWASNNPEFIFRPPMPMSQPIYARPAQLSDPEADRYYRERAFQWISTHPVDFVVNAFRKLIALYNFDPMSWRPEVSELYRVAGIFPYGILIPFMTIGLITNFRNPKFWVIIWYILFSTGMAMLFYGDSRIRAPIQPYLYILGVMGISATITRLREWPRQQLVVVSATGRKS